MQRAGEAVEIMDCLRPRIGTDHRPVGFKMCGDRNDSTRSRQITGQTAQEKMRGHIGLQQRRCPVGYEKAGGLFLLGHG